MPKSFKILISSMALTFVMGAVSLAEAADIEVVFPGRVAGNMGSLNDIERNREESFRETRDENASQRGRSAAYMELVRLENVDWAGEALIPDVSDYNVENLFKALAAETLSRADMDNLEGTIRFTIRTLKVAGHSLNFLRSTDTYVIGTVEHIGANGQVLGSEKISANLVTDVSVDANYKGPDFAFYVTEENGRVGPAFSRFIQKSLEKLFDRKDFSGPIIIG